MKTLELSLTIKEWREPSEPLMTSAQIELDAPELRCSAQIALDVIALMPEPSLAIRIEAERLWYMLKEQLSIDSYLDNLERENLEGLL